MLRHLGQRQRAGRRYDTILVNLDTGQGCDLRPGRDDDIVGGIAGILAVGRDNYLARLGDPGRPGDFRDLVLLEQAGDALGQAVDDLVLARHQRLQIQFDLAHLYAVLGKMVPRLFELLRRMQQRLRRNAADIETCAAKRAAFIDAGGFKTKLGSPDCGDIAARTRTDNDQVEMGITHNFRLSIKRRAGCVRDFRCIP